MNRPLQRGTGINANRYTRWISQFGNYRGSVTRNSIEHWIGQFANPHQDVAARILDSVLFISYQAIQTNYRNLLNSLQGWHISASQRRGEWYFVPFSSSSGQSGDSMMHYFRTANNLSHRRYDPMFIYRRDLGLKKLTPDDTIVFVDDFSASGEQACNFWRDVFSEIIIGTPRIVLLLIAGTNDAIKRIRTETSMEPHCNHVLTNRDNIFHAACRFYNPQEKTVILDYCTRVDRRNPRGFGDRGLLIVFAHRCPNNSIPILHTDRAHWTALFPRFD